MDSNTANADIFINRRPGNMLKEKEQFTLNSMTLPNAAFTFLIKPHNV
jgi:hypothetical protein